MLTASVSAGNSFTGERQDLPSNLRTYSMTPGFKRLLVTKPFMLLAIVPLILAFVVVPSGRSGAASPSLVRFTANSRQQLGTVLLNLADQAVVLGRDGQLHTLEGAQAKAIQAEKGTFSSISAPELKSQLANEFGGGFEVKLTQHFVIVQPKNRGSHWPELFECSHRSFLHYMSKRNVNIRSGRFPMVAVVMPDEAAMYRELGKMGLNAKRVAGVYARESNRVITHDGGHRGMVESTLRHEAAHQSAYNYNVHSRVTVTPRWITEGLGQMFEPTSMATPVPGHVWRDRVNHECVDYLNAMMKDKDTPGLADAMSDLVGSDEMFANPKTTVYAYSLAWAMLFYLAEHEPNRFQNLIHDTASRRAFRKYPRQERLIDFHAWAGCSPDQFAIKLTRFLESI